MVINMLGNEAQEKAKRREIQKLIEMVIDCYGLNAINLFQDMCGKLLGHQGQLWGCAWKRFLRKETDIFQDFENYNCFRSLWKKIYDKQFGLGRKVNFEHVIIPTMPTGRNWELIMINPNLKISSLHDRLVQVLENLVYPDRLIAVKRPVESQAIWLRLGRKVECLSANDLVEDGRDQLYLEDAIIFLVAYFEQHGRRLNLDGVKILCLASESVDGRVVLVKGTEDGLIISLVDPSEKQENLLQLEKAE